MNDMNNSINLYKILTKNTYKSIKHSPIPMQLIILKIKQCFKFAVIDVKQNVCDSKIQDTEGQ